MKLSIIVPVYNMAADNKLNYCIDSLINQTLKDRGYEYEIIPVDDASKDDSPSILRKYERDYPELIHPVYCERNHRQGGARNRGIAKAKGEWIGFMDSDDFAHPEMFYKLIKRAEDTGADVVGCHYNMTNNHSFDVGKVMAVNTPDQTGVLGIEQYKKLVLQPGSMVIKIYKADVIREKELSFPENTFYEDNQAGPLWMLSFKHFEIVDEPLYYYFQNEESTVHTISLDRLHNRMSMSESLVLECKERGLYEAYASELEANFTRCYYVNTLFSYMQDAVANKDKIQKRFVEELRQGVLKYFPDFQKNKYYERSYDEEQRKLIAYHMAGSGKFIRYYKMLMMYRRIRYGK